MYSFLFHAGSDINDVQQSLHRAAKKTTQVSLAYNPELTTQIQLLPEMHAGWFIQTPNHQTIPPYITTHVDDELAILVYGSSIDGSKNHMATLLAEEWKVRGVMGLRRLDNLFSSIVIDRRARKVYLVCDQLGLRSLHYFVSGNQIWVSPHDVPIVAGSPCRLDINPLAVYSVCKVGWSLNGVPLLSDLLITDAKHIYVWENGTLTKLQDHIFEGVKRLNDRDETGKASLLDSLIEYLDDQVQSILKDHDTISMDLTAGWDTRTVAALLLHNAGGRKLMAFTNDLVADREYQTAKWFAQYYHIEHLRSGPKARLPESMDNTLTAHAFYSNGKGTCFRLFNEGTVIRDANTPHFTGHNADFIRGHFYPDKSATDPSSGKGIDIASNLNAQLIDSNSLVYSLEWDNALRQMLKGTITELSKISSHPYDIFDLFYLYERLGQWSTRDAALTVETGVRKYCLFEHPALIRGISQMPAPISQNYALQRKIIKAYAPRSYYKLINDRTFIPALSNRYLRRFIKKAFNVKSKLAIQNLSLVKPVEEQIAQKEIDDLLLNYVKERILDVDSVIFTVLSKAMLEKTTQLQSPPSLQLKTLWGHLIEIETWYKQIKEVRKGNGERMNG